MESFVWLILQLLVGLLSTEKTKYRQNIRWLALLNGSRVDGVGESYNQRADILSLGITALN